VNPLSQQTLSAGGSPNHAVAAAAASAGATPAARSTCDSTGIPTSGLSAAEEIRVSTVKLTDGSVPNAVSWEFDVDPSIAIVIAPMAKTLNEFMSFSL